jgi:hypothetical protein
MEVWTGQVLPASQFFEVASHPSHGRKIEELGLRKEVAEELVQLAIVVEDEEESKGQVLRWHLLEDCNWREIGSGADWELYDYAERS